VDVLNRRLAGEPLQYILGFEWFYRSRFEVGPGCLIPRKETELIVDEVLKHRSGEKIRVAELGAGSGNIGISVLLERPQVEWHAFELNPASFDFAQKNQRKILNQSASYRLYQGDFFSESPAHGPYDVVVSNPPYVSFKEMEELPLEVKKEPALALEAGEDGLTIIRRLLDHLPVVLKSKGLFLCEIGSNQKQELERELKTRKFPDFEILSDLSGLPRILKLLVQ
ncbi:MAG: peptide chain release factor N(5)-glutamine methyltransferase, partial [Proteobacteria bacterium]|nr:peptide chain release factor N(5)-glutamine methyltransferase [Pseudomonadota bacterium]